jgi:phosphate/sulfate permease
MATGVARLTKAGQGGRAGWIVGASVALAVAVAIAGSVVVWNRIAVAVVLVLLAAALGLFGAFFFRASFRRLDAARRSYDQYERAEQSQQDRHQ